jgi:hypothetical protein
MRFRTPTAAALLACLAVAGLARNARADLILQFDTVSIIAPENTPISGTIELYAQLTGATTAPTLEGLDTELPASSPIVFTSGPAQGTTIHPWVFSSTGATFHPAFTPSTPPGTKGYDEISNSGSGATLDNTNSGIISIPFTAPANTYGTFPINALSTLLFDPDAGPITFGPGGNGMTLAGSITIAIPEPSSMLLASLAAASATWYQRRRARRCEQDEQARSPVAT